MCACEREYLQSFLLVYLLFYLFIIIIIDKRNRKVPKADFPRMEEECTPSPRIPPFPFGFPGGWTIGHRFLGFDDCVSLVSTIYHEPVCCQNE